MVWITLWSIQLLVIILSSKDGKLINMEMSSSSEICQNITQRSVNQYHLKNDYNSLHISEKKKNSFQENERGNLTGKWLDETCCWLAH